MNHEVVNPNQHQDNDDMNHDVEDSTHQQLLSADGGIDQDGQEDECVDSDLPFSGLDDDSLVEEMKDISQQQGKPTIQNDEYHQVKKVYRKRKLSSGDIEYYLSWANQPAKKYRCWVKRDDFITRITKIYGYKKDTVHVAMEDSLYTIYMI